jgi:hypothetical protein
VDPGAVRENLPGTPRVEAFQASGYIFALHPHPFMEEPLSWADLMA